ncbi:MAG TPA: hypothetical protein DCL48_12110 [Alphaproteobacteria bacterium]|nr:hypothetical protein [Alphaproteobacteria bacterium]
MSISQYVIGGSALAVAVAVGYAKWTSKSAEVATGRADVAIVKAECATDIADDVTQSALQQVTTLAAQVEEQKGVIRGLTKKADDRLRENNELRRKINNATDNPPIPDAAEYALDRLRGAVSEDDANKDPNESGDSPNPDSDGGGVSETAIPAS